MRALVAALLFVAGCGPAGRHLASSSAMQRRQDIWNRCRSSIEQSQCGDDPDTFYRVVCMRRIGDRYFDTSSLDAARGIAVENGCPESIAGASSVSTAAATPPTWSDRQIYETIVRIDGAVASCFDASRLPARMSLTFSARGQVEAHQVLTDHTAEEAGCVARLLVSVEVEGDVRTPRTIDASFGRTPQ